jgi:hypothetical protein
LWIEFDQADFFTIQGGIARKNFCDRHFLFLLILIFYFAPILLGNYVSLVGTCSSTGVKIRISGLHVKNVLKTG